MEYCPGSIDTPEVLEAMDLYQHSKMLPGTPIGPSLLAVRADLLDSLAVIDHEMAFVEFHHQVESNKKRK